MGKTQEFINSMGEDWWKDLEYEEKIGYHGKLIAENWEDDWKLLVESVMENTDLSREQVFLFLLVQRFDRVQDILSRTYGWYPQGKPGPERPI